MELSSVTQDCMQQIATWNLEKGEDFLTQWAGSLYTYPLTPEQMHALSVLPDVRMFVLHDHGALIGTISLLHLSAHDKTATLGLFLMSPLYIGKGLGEKALRTTIDYAFHTLGLRRLRVNIYDDNLRAMRCYVKCGFQTVSEQIMDSGCAVYHLVLDNE